MGNEGLWRVPTGLRSVWRGVVVLEEWRIAVGGGDGAGDSKNARDNTLVH